MNWSSVNCINDKLQQLIRHSSNGLYEFILISSSSSCTLLLFQYQAQETNVKSVFFSLYFMVFYNVFPSSYYKRQISCPFVCLEFSVPLEIFFSLIRRRHHYRRRAANFDIYSALMAIVEWEFFSVPDLLWHAFI